MVATAVEGGDESATSGKSTLNENTTSSSLTVTDKQKLKKSKPKPNQLPQHVQSLLSSAAVSAQSFVSQNDLVLPPSQFLTLDSLLSSPPISTVCPPPPPPLPPSPTWFHRFMLSASSDRDPRWLSCFRMSKPNFYFFLSIISPSITPLLPPFITPDFALAAVLFRLAHTAAYRSMALLFGFDSSETACRVFFSVCKGVIEKLGNLSELRNNINQIVEFPNCCGALGFGKFKVDCTDSGQNRYRRTLLVQALVDSEGRFIDISAGWPSTLKTETILRKSKLYSAITDSKELLNGSHYKLSNGNMIPQYMLGDSSFPLLPWLITPFARQNEEDSFSSVENEFNSAHNRSMKLVGTAFDKLRARWQLLGKGWTDKCVEIFPFVIVTGCLLHNFLISVGESMPKENDKVSRVEEDVEEEEEELKVFDGEGDDEGRRIRDLLAHHLREVTGRT